MTLPVNSYLPPYVSRILESRDETDKYLSELSDGLERMYEDMINVVNGSFRQNSQVGNLNWTPIIKDTANSATTFTYDHQIGWVLRQGTLVDCWFDVEWTANSGAIAGNMYLVLPYQVALTSNMPFVGLIQSSVFAFTGGADCVINAISNTFRGEIWNCGSGFTTANQASKAAGRLIGHIRYIGKQNET